MVKVEKKKERHAVRVSPDLEVVHVSGGLGVTVDFDGITIIPLMTMIKAGEFGEVTEETPPIESVIKYMITLPPYAAKLLVDMLDSAVKEYEKSYGKISMPPSE